MKINEIADALKLPSINIGDEVRVGKFKNRKDEHNQPVLKTTKGDQKLFKPRISKLMKESYKTESKQIKTKKNPDGFTIDLIVDGKHVGQYTHAREDDIVRNQAEIFPEYRNKGYGTMLLLAAIKTANDLGLDFEEDTQSLTPAMSRIYD